MKSVLLGFAAAAALATSASATTAIFDFQSPGGVNGVTATYMNNGLSIVASGFANTTGTTATLFDKTLGGDESGLGLTNDLFTGQNEISGSSFVQIDTSLLPAGSTDSFQMGSTTGTEKWAVFGSNSADTLGTLVATGTDELVPHLLTGGFRYYDFKDVPTSGTCGSDLCPGNVLLHSITAVTAVPEPATWAMMLVGIGGLGAAMRLSRKSVGQAALA